MQKSTKFLVGGTFFIAAFAFASAVFQGLGMDFGTGEMIGSSVAGGLGALRLVA